MSTEFTKKMLPIAAEALIKDFDTWTDNVMADEIDLDHLVKVHDGGSALANALLEQAALTMLASPTTRAMRSIAITSLCIEVWIQNHMDDCNECRDSIRDSANPWRVG